MAVTCTIAQYQRCLRSQYLRIIKIYLTITGFINEESLKNLEESVHPRMISVGLEIRNAPKVNEALLEFDGRHSGLKRSHLLKTLASSECQLLECVDRDTCLVGYSLVLEHPTLVQVQVYE